MARAKYFVRLTKKGMAQFGLIECCICGDLISDDDSNNAWPVVEDGQCCGMCNGDVIEARLARMEKQQ